MDRLTSALAVPLLVSASFVQCGGSDESRPPNYEGNGGAYDNPIAVKPDAAVGDGTTDSSTTISGGVAQALPGNASGAVNGGGAGDFGLAVGLGGAMTLGAGGAMTLGAGGAMTLGAGGAMTLGAGGGVATATAPLLGVPLGFGGSL